MRHESEDQIRARLTAFQRTGDVNMLWPDVPPPERRRALAQIRVATQALLAGRASALGAAGEDEAKALGVAAFAAGMGPLLGWWIQRGELGASTAARAVFEEHLAHGVRRSRVLRGETARLLRAMESAGVRPIVLKGLHTGAEFFPDPSTRPAGDIDILVHPSERPRAVAVLRELGFVERRFVFGARSEWTHPDAPKTARSLRLDHADNPWSVDLHHALERWYFRGTRRDLGTEAFATTRSIEIEGVRAHVLAQPHLAAFLALHAGYVLAKCQLVRFVELALVLRADASAGRLDAGALASLLERTDAGRFAYPALTLAEELCPGCVGPDVLEVAGRRVGPRLQRVVAAVRAAEWGPLPERSLDLKLAWAVGPRETLLNLTEIVLPSDDGMGGLREAYAQRLRMVGRKLGVGDAPEEGGA